MKNRLANKPVAGERLSEVFVVAGVKLRLVLPAKLPYNGVMFAGEVMFCVVPHF